jgi:transcriptional regulator with XRE-family HTH domain
MTAKKPTLGERIQAERLKAGLSQSQLARAAGVPAGTLRNWEQDKRQPYASALAALLAALELPLGPLLEGVTFPTVEAPGRAGRPRKVQAAANPAPSEEKPVKKRGKKS